MDVSLHFLSMVTDFIGDVFSYYIFPGVTLGTVVYYNFFLVVFFTAFARRS